MELKKIEEFAKSKGFQKIKYMGEYEGKPAYAPLREKMAYIGMPFFILVDGNKLEMITGKQGLKILNELSSKPIQDSKIYVAVKDGNAIVFDDRWITINADPDEPGQGQHVLIKENGDIVAGLGGNFKNLKDLGKKPKEVVTVDELYNYLKTHEGNIFLKLASDMGTYNPVKYHKKQPTMNEIIDNLGGADKTKGSCVSLAMAYTAQRGGMDVLDFKGGKSQKFFSGSTGLHASLQDGLAHTERDSRKGGVEVLENLKNYPPDKEFLLRSGNHMAVVRRNKDGIIQYLELQSRRKCEWKDMGETESKAGRKNIETTLKNRFMTKTDRSMDAQNWKADLYDCDKLRESKAFKVALGFINTDKDKQQKGAGGDIK